MATPQQQGALFREGRLVLANNTYKQDQFDVSPCLSDRTDASLNKIMGRGVNHIDKHRFLPLYRQAGQAALHRENIQAGFAATGLVPYSPERVLAQLHAEYQTPSPQRRPRSNASWAAETPHNITQVQQQTALIKHCRKRCTHSPPSQTERPLAQLVKGCEMAMSSAVQWKTSARKGRRHSGARI
jgi:hypothetical protein